MNGASASTATIEAGEGAERWRRALRSGALRSGPAVAPAAGQALPSPLWGGRGWGARGPGREPPHPIPPPRGGREAPA